LEAVLERVAGIACLADPCLERKLIARNRGRRPRGDNPAAGENDDLPELDGRVIRGSHEIVLKAEGGPDLRRNGSQRRGMPQIQSRGFVDANSIPSLNLAVYRIDPVLLELDTLDAGRGLGEHGRSCSEQQREDEPEEFHVV